MSVKKSRNRPLIALVGRTNVGKSTLWNRLTETANALVSNQPHTTRDRHYGIVLWQGSCFDVVDTGGMDVEANEIGEGILSQSEKAIAEADLVLFVVDAQSGILPQDRELARHVHGLTKNVWLVGNKADNMKQASLVHEPEFYQLNLGEAHAISAVTSFGVGDLLDSVVAECNRLGRPPVPMTNLLPLRLVIVGRPNVGKSSLTNAILGEERVIVSAIPHTTREPQDTWLNYKEKDIVLVDTAGMRKKAHIKTQLEEASIDRNERSIKHSDVALFVFDATEDPSTQDRRLAGVLQEANKGLILVANKWDLVENKKTGSTDIYERLIRQLFPFLDWAPMIFISAKHKQRTTTLLDHAIKVQEERNRHIDYNALNRLLKACIKTMRPLASYGPKSPRIYDVAQVGQAPPTFLLTVVGEKDNIHPNWVKFFQKRLREKFGFVGTPIIVKARNLPLAKSEHKRNVHGPGMEAVAGPVKEKKRLVNQTRRRQKLGGRRY